MNDTPNDTGKAKAPRAKKAAPAAKTEVSAIDKPSATYVLPQSVIEDSKALGNAINKWAPIYLAAGQAAHVIFLSALWHAAKHGNPALLNRAYAVLRTNDQQAARLFVRRAHILVATKGDDPGSDTLAEILQGYADAGKVVDFKQGSFVVVKGHTSDEAKMLCKLIEERFIKPDGKTDMLLLERNNIAAMQLVGDNELLDSILRLAKSMDTDSERRKVTVSDPVRKFITAFRDKAEVMKQQLGLATQS